MNEELDIETVPFITHVPKSTIALKIIATIFVNGETHEAEMTLNDAADIRDGMIKGDEWDFENVKYVVNEDALNE